jgi:ParB family chromosome partitioning protein
VLALKASIEAIGLQTPPTVVERDGRYVLIAGRHRLEALRLLKAEKVPVRVVDMDDREARMWTIAENLHRNELTAVQRAEAIQEWRKLAAKKGGEISRPSGNAQPHDIGVSATARELGIDRKEVRTANKIANITPAAKEAAATAGVKTQADLFKVASYADDDQVEAVAAIVAEREKKKAGPTERTVLAPLEGERSIEQTSCP